MSRTLVTFALKAYNQRAYIKEALEGALRQTYRPLEIVISDDGSTDGSFAVIEDVLNAGHDPSITVVLNRNETNLGNVKNFERIGELAHGELIVKADGDDVSHPDRAERIVEAWERDGKRAKVITHAVRTIGEGRVIEGHDAKRPLGAGMAWTRDCFTGWPEIGEDCRRSFDDIVYAARALLLGPELVMKEVLVDYRVGSGETSTADPRHSYARGIEGLVAAVPQKLRDLKNAAERGIIDGAREEAEERSIEREAERFGGYYALFAAARFKERLAGFRKVCADFNWRGRVMFATYLLPGEMGVGARAMLEWARRRLHG